MCLDLHGSLCRPQALPFTSESHTDGGFWAGRVYTTGRLPRQPLLLCELSGVK